jgi:ketosteroid isomerase-like protein
MKTLSAFVLTTLVLALPRGWAQTPSPEQTLIALETSWSQAAITRDGAALDRFYADEYIFTNEDGVTTNKTKEIANITSGTFRLTAFKFNDVKVHLYGDVAVVTGENDVRGTWEDINKDISGPYRFTDVFVKRTGRWQCVASQSSRITPRKELP